MASSTTVEPRKAAVCQLHQAKSLPAKVTHSIGRLAVAASSTRAEVVDLGLTAADVEDLQSGLDHEQRDDGERYADEEAPAPAEGGVDQQAAEQRAGDGADGHHGAHVAGVPAALTRER